VADCRASSRRAPCWPAADLPGLTSSSRQPRPCRCRPCRPGGPDVGHRAGRPHPGGTRDTGGRPPGPSGAVAFLMPTGHNPTGAVMPLLRRQALARVADAGRVTIVEDLGPGRPATRGGGDVPPRWRPSARRSSPSVGPPSCCGAACGSAGSGSGDHGRMTRCAARRRPKGSPQPVDLRAARRSRPVAGHGHPCLAGRAPRRAHRPADHLTGPHPRALARLASDAARRGPVAVGTTSGTSADAFTHAPPARRHRFPLARRPASVLPTAVLPTTVRPQAVLRTTVLPAALPVITTTCGCRSPSSPARWS